LTYTPAFQKLVIDHFEVYIRVRAEIDPMALNGVSSIKQSPRQKGMATVRNSMLQRGASKSLRWALTQIPTYQYEQVRDWISLNCRIWN